MLNHTIFYVATRNDCKIGCYAVAGKIHASNNLAHYTSIFDTFNVCKTYKEAQTIAEQWNKDFKNNGIQKAI